MHCFWLDLLYSCKFFLCFHFRRFVSFCVLCIVFSEIFPDLLSPSVDVMPPRSAHRTISRLLCMVFGTAIEPYRTFLAMLQHWSRTHQEKMLDAFEFDTTGPGLKWTLQWNGQRLHSCPTKLVCWQIKALLANGGTWRRPCVVWTKFNSSNISPLLTETKDTIGRRRVCSMIHLSTNCKILLIQRHTLRQWESCCTDKFWRIFRQMGSSMNTKEESYSTTRRWLNCAASPTSGRWR